MVDAKPKYCYNIIIKVEMQCPQFGCSSCWPLTLPPPPPSASVWAAPAVWGEPHAGSGPGALRPDGLVRADPEQPLLPQRCHPAAELHCVRVPSCCPPVALCCGVDRERTETFNLIEFNWTEQEQKRAKCCKWIDPPSLCFSTNWNVSVGTSCDWQARWNSRANQGREALIGQKKARGGRGDRSSSTNMFSS